MNLLSRLFESRFWALTLKEIRQILKNRQLIFLLIFPPTVQLLIFGLALSPDVNRLSLGIVDFANSAQSREFVSALVENQVFEITIVATNQSALNQQIAKGKNNRWLNYTPRIRSPSQ